MFKEITEFDGRYLVSDSGVVVNRRGRVLKPGINPRTGYAQFVWRKNGKAVMRYLHRLVAATFLENPHSAPIVNHKDGNKLNNHVSNLEWVSYSENATHAYKTGLSRTTAIVAYTKTGDFVRMFKSEKEAMRFCGVSYNAGISNCLRGVTNTAHGYVWKYKFENLGC